MIKDVPLDKTSWTALL